MLLQSHPSQAREKEALLLIEVLVERAPLLVLMEKERECPEWDLRLKGRGRMEKVHQRRVAVQKEKGMALVLIPVVVMARERLRWKERIQLH